MRRKSAVQDENHPAFLPTWKLPPVKERHHADAWIALLDTVLPTRLRSAPLEQDLVRSDGVERSPDVLTPKDVALILHRAQKSYGIDILTHMGVEKGQWKAVVWLVTRIVDNLWKVNSDQAVAKIQSAPSALWKGQTSLDEATRNDRGIHLDSSSNLPPIPTPSLGELTMDLSPLYEPLQANLIHNVLGVVWRSLGNMIIADAAARKDKPTNTITPEILEIIAGLHHSGMMPSSIYSYQPSDESNGLRQPPTLHLLSSHILTSLTDAAWRAHESLVVEEAKVKGGEYLSMRPEIPGSMYKVHVAGLGHEVWLEIVLWACLRGQWIEEGSSILRNVTQDYSWSALSWRELAAPLIQPGQEESINWDDLNYRLNAGNIYGDPALTNAAKNKVKRTISTEVITAFVEALVDSIQTSVGARGTSATNVLQYISPLKSFLDKSELSLGSTSWDAIVLRFFESQGVDVQKEPGLAERIVRLLSSQFGKELSATNAPARNEQWQPLPAYALDGTAVSLGLMHRVLRSFIEQSNLAGALRTFEELQAMADRNKQKSINDFFNRQALEAKELPAARDSDSEINFESRYGGIEYPGFYPQLPSSILAPFLDLITETRSFAFGKWLLHSEDIDGPIIPESMYVDPLMGPALVRFASEMEDTTFLVKLLKKQDNVQQKRGNGSKVPPSSLLALLQGQVHLRKWDVVDQILTTIKESPGFSLEGQSFAILARAIIREAGSDHDLFQHLTRSSDFQRVFDIFLQVANDASNLNKDFYHRVRTTTMVMACISPRWEAFLSSFKHARRNTKYTMTANSFNTVLDGVASTYGSKAAKRFLGRFWKAAIDDRIVDLNSEIETGVVRMRTERPSSRAKPGQYDISIRLGELATGEYMVSKQSSVLHGLFSANATTVRVVLRKALQENRDIASMTKEMDDKEMEWARRLWTLLGLKERDIDHEINTVLGQIEDESKVEAEEVSGDVVQYSPAV